jgi:hypothetical protein
MITGTPLGLLLVTVIAVLLIGGPPAPAALGLRGVEFRLTITNLSEPGVQARLTVEPLIDQALVLGLTRT